MREISSQAGSSMSLTTVIDRLSTIAVEYFASYEEYTSQNPQIEKNSKVNKIQAMYWRKNPLNGWRHASYSGIFPSV